MIALMPRVVLFLVVLLPALAVSWGVRDGAVTFVLYREPKLAAAMIGSWLLLAVLAWARPAVVSARELGATLRRPAVAVGVAFVAWTALSGLWGQVPELYFYEIQQYATLTLLWLGLLTWARLESGVADTVRAALCAGAAVVTAVAFAQLSGIFPALDAWLRPINPQFGASHPSLMGYKNPAALAILGQLFLLAGLAAQARSTRGRVLLGALAAAEIAYLATLHSRTSYVALGVGGAFAVGLAASRPSSRRHLPKILGGVAALGAVFAVALLADSGSAARFRSLADVASPRAYLESDRGTYLRNTLNMVEHHPAGVGLGGWQTFYPVYRLHDRYRSFDASFQVRRAHSDHVQVLGETGWIGLGLWTAWLGLLLVGPARRYRREGRLDALFTTAQLVVVCAAMATDYVVEMPFHKLLFFLLAFLAVVASQAPSSAPETMPRARRPAQLAVALLISAVALAMFLYQAEALRKQQLSAELLRRYTAVIDTLAREGRVSAAAIEETRRLGRGLDDLRGTSKTYHRDHLARAHLALLTGDGDDARAQIACALALHPYSPQALGLMARAVPAEESAKWLRAQTHVMDEATAGISGKLPKIPTNCPN